MAEVFSRFKNFLGFGSGNTAPDTDEYVDDIDDERASFAADSEDEYTVVTKDRYSRVSNSAPTYTGRQTREPAPEKHTERVAEKTERTGEKSKVINMGVNSNLRVVLSKPSAFDNCEAICSHLRGQMTVVLNLEFVPEVGDRRRIFDFVSGCCYALDCSIQRVSDLIYVIAPSNVDVLAEVTEEEEESAFSAF
ncbi:MAG: cell division protein SepF [Clostridia bacterium]|jgi:cell division inhibitor SepF|nr:cell division protein SepF [Clostridia bacterium]